MRRTWEDPLLEALAAYFLLALFRDELLGIAVVLNNIIHPHLAGLEFFLAVAPPMDSLGT